MTKDMMRLLVMQLAGVAGLFAFANPRLKAAYNFVMTLTTPEIWDQVWALATGEGIEGKKPRFGSTGLEGTAAFNQSAPFVCDPLDALAGKGTGGTAEYAGE